MVGSTASGLQWKSKNNQVMHQRCSLKIDSTKDGQKWNQWFRDIVGIKVCLTACQIQAKKPKARSPVQVLAGSNALLHVNRDWSWYSVKFYPGILLQNLISVWTSFLSSQATFYCGAWDSCWASRESIDLAVGRTQNKIPSKVLQRWAPIFMMFVSNFGNWWHYQDLSPVRRSTMKLDDRGIPKLNAQKNGSVRTGPQNWMCTQHILDNPITPLTSFSHLLSFP